VNETIKNNEVNNQKVNTTPHKQKICFLSLNNVHSSILIRYEDIVDVDLYRLFLCVTRKKLNWNDSSFHYFLLLTVQSNSVITSSVTLNSQISKNKNSYSLVQVSSLHYCPAYF
jgi:hypothetical protein